MMTMSDTWELPVRKLRDQLLEMTHDLDERIAEHAELYANRKGKDRQYARRIYLELATLDSARANIAAAARYLSGMIYDD
jgi:hypothetical protein